MALLRLAALSQLALAALAAPAALRGEEVRCVRDRAHLVRFDVAGEPSDGSSMRGIERALISVEPSPAHAERCRGRLGAEPSGDTQFCYGVNQNSTCDGAKEVLPIQDGFECVDCYVSASADAFYKLNYSAAGLNSVTVGLRDIHLRASAGVHKVLSGSDKPVQGFLTLPGSNQSVTVIDTLVGCPVCVKVSIKVSVPTALEYDLTYSGHAEAEAAVGLDVNLGNNTVHYDSSAGWDHETHHPTMSVKPTLTASADVEADLKLQLRTSLAVSVDNIIWYNLYMDPALPLTLKFNGGFGPFKHAGVCLDGDASFSMAQEADLDWDLIVWHAKDHWGPSKLYSVKKPGIFHFCKEVDAANSSTLVV